MAEILIQPPFITKKWMCIIKKGQRPRSKGQKFFGWVKFFFRFLHELGYSDLFGKISFFGLVAFMKAIRPKIFTVCKITFYSPSNKQIKISKLYSNNGGVILKMECFINPGTIQNCEDYGNRGPNNRGLTV